jgi:hypothetical protein
MAVVACSVSQLPRLSVDKPLQPSTALPGGRMAVRKMRMNENDNLFLSVFFMVKNCSIHSIQFFGACRAAILKFQPLKKRFNSQITAFVVLHPNCLFDKLAKNTKYENNKPFILQTYS